MSSLGSRLYSLTLSALYTCVLFGAVTAYPCCQFMISSETRIFLNSMSSWHLLVSPSPTLWRLYWDLYSWDSAPQTCQWEDCAYGFPVPRRKQPRLNIVRSEYLWREEWPFRKSRVTALRPHHTVIRPAHLYLNGQLVLALVVFSGLPKSSRPHLEGWLLQSYQLTQVLRDCPVSLHLYKNLVSSWAATLLTYWVWPWKVLDFWTDLDLEEFCWVSFTGKP